MKTACNVIIINTTIMFVSILIFVNRYLFRWSNFLVDKESTLQGFGCVEEAAVLQVELGCFLVTFLGFFELTCYSVALGWNKMA